MFGKFVWICFSKSNQYWNSTETYCEKMSEIGGYAIKIDEGLF